MPTSCRATCLTETPWPARSPAATPSSIWRRSTATRAPTPRRWSASTSRARASCSRRRAARRVVHTASCATCGPVAGRAATESDTPARWELRVPYKRTKLAGERLALEAAAGGADVVIVNPTTPVGPGDRRPDADRQDGGRRRQRPCARLPRGQRAERRRGRGRRPRAPAGLRARSGRAALPAGRREPDDARGVRGDLRRRRAPGAEDRGAVERRLRGGMARHAREARSGAAGARRGARRALADALRRLAGAQPSSATAPSRRSARSRARRGPRSSDRKDVARRSYSAGHSPVRSNSSRARASRSRSGWLCGPSRTATNAEHDDQHDREQDSADHLLDAASRQCQQDEARQPRDAHGDDRDALSHDQASLVTGGRARGCGCPTPTASRWPEISSRRPSGAQCPARGRRTRCRTLVHEVEAHGGRRSERERRGRGEAPRGVLVERLDDHGVQGDRHRRPVLAGPGRLIVQVRGDPLGLRAGRVGHARGQRLVEHAAQRVDVRGRPDALAAASAREPCSRPCRAARPRRSGPPSRARA